MLVAQDLLRDNTWYSDVDKFPKGKTGCKEDYICIDALVASPFGLHGKSWRDKRMEVAEWHCLLKNLLNMVMAFILQIAENIVYMTIESRTFILLRKRYWRKNLK